MIKFTFTAVALTAASTVAFADGSDWLELDQDIANLSTTVNTAEGATVGALVRTSYRDVDTTGGFSQDDIDLFAQGSLEEFSWRVSFDMDSGNAVLEDAYVSWSYDSGFTVIWGQFKAPALRSAVIDPENLLFIDRSNLGQFHDFWDTGLGIVGDIQDGLSYTLAVRNGFKITDAIIGPPDVPGSVDWNNDDEDLFYFANLTYSVGNGLSPMEGALKAGEELDATVGVTYWDQEEDSLDPVWVFDIAATMGQFSAALELADGGDDDDNLLEAVTKDVLLTNGFGTNPLALTLSYLLADNMEAAYRYEDYDNSADDKKSSFGLNYYLHGHNAKWQINYIDDDVAGDEEIAIGLTVGATR